MKNYTWARSAMAAGGTLTIQAVLPGKSILRAEMSWPGGQTIKGNVSLSIEGALDRLEEKLLDDATDEHLKNSGL